MSLPTEPIAAAACLLAMGATDDETARAIDLLGPSSIPDTVPELLAQLRTALEFTRTATALEQHPEPPGPSQPDR